MAIKDKYIKNEKFIEYLSFMTKDSLKIALACHKTNFGKWCIGKNLFNKAWTPGCDKPFIEIDSTWWDGYKETPIKKKIIKYRSWQESVDDFDDPIEPTGNLLAIMKLYNLKKDKGGG